MPTHKTQSEVDHCISTTRRLEKVGLYKRPPRQVNGPKPQSAKVPLIDLLPAKLAP